MSIERSPTGLKFRLRSLESLLTLREDEKTGLSSTSGGDEIPYTISEFGKKADEKKKRLWIMKAPPNSSLNSLPPWILVSTYLSIVKQSKNSTIPHHFRWSINYKGQTSDTCFCVYPARSFDVGAKDIQAFNYNTTCRILPDSTGLFSNKTG